MASSSKKKRAYEPSREKWLAIVGPSLDILPRKCLPTNRVVMQRYKALSIQFPRKNYSFYAETLYGEVKDIWTRTNIPLAEKRTCTKRIERLLESWQRNRCRDTDEGSKEMQKYQESLNNVLNMTFNKVTDVEDSLKGQHLLRRPAHCTEDNAKVKKIWEIEYEWYLGQLQWPQVGHFGVRDNTYSSRLQASIGRKEAKSNMERAERTRKRGDESTHSTVDEIELETVVGVASGEESADDSGDPDWDERPRRQRKIKRIDKVLLELPTKDL